MKKTLLCSLAVFAMLALPKNMVQASEDPGSNKYHITTIRWIDSTKDNLDDDDRYVVIIGKVTGKVGDESYTFNDGTGTIMLDSEGIKLPIGKSIVVRGRIDQDYFGNSFTGEGLEVDVRSWRAE
jgi:uncharacterized protein YdeI (BOF family)